MNFIQQGVRKYLYKLLSLPYLSKKAVFVADIAFAAIIFTISTSICYSLVGKTVPFEHFVTKLLIYTVLNCIFFILFSTHKGILRYSSYRDNLRIFLALLCSNIFLLIILLNAYDQSTLTIITIIINFVFGFGLIIFARMMVRLFFDYVKMTYNAKKNIPLLIFGDKQTHISLAKMISGNEYMPYSIAGFISSESRKTNQKIMNYPIYTKSEFLTGDSNFRHIGALLIVSEELDPAEKQLLVEKCLKYNIELLSAPSPNNLKANDKESQKIRKVRIEELLERSPIQTDIKSIGEQLKGKTVLVTGAAGSIGSEIVRQLCQFDVAYLLLCDIAETPLNDLCLELDKKYPEVKKELFIADVRNFNRINSIFKQYRPQYIYHAAAYKHVPMMEQQPAEAIITNVFGTKNVADLAIEYNSECFVMISTDKAVNPSSVMGASKRIAEIYIQYLVNSLKEKENSSIRFITTRFGNVLGSNGSVIPLFTKQIEAGGPITVTHPEIYRYFMTISEACNLVLEAGNFGKGGEIFTFDMGKSVNIKSMAESMIRLSGLIPYKDIDIVYTGLRPGEKLYEELLHDQEQILPTRHEKIMITKLTECNYEEILPLLQKLYNITSEDDKFEIVKLMKEIVPEYESLNSIYNKLDIEN